MLVPTETRGEDPSSYRRNSRSGRDTLPRYPEIAARKYVYPIAGQDIVLLLFSRRLRTFARTGNLLHFSAQNSDN
jgi:hypothetical protein